MTKIFLVVVSLFVVAGLLESSSSVGAQSLDQGALAARHGDYIGALEEWKPLAEKGEAAAGYAVGYMYEFGKGVPQDYAQAAVWYRKAANQGHYWARFRLGVLFARGRGVPRDNAEAKEWINLAAEQGKPEDKFEIGMLLAGNLFWLRDIALGHRWVRMAADLGYAKALHRMALWNDSGLWHAGGILVRKDQIAAVRLILQAAEMGYAPSQHLAGRWYLDEGKGLRDRARAYFWLDKAASQGITQARISRDVLVRQMTPKELAESSRWRQLDWPPKSTR